MVEVSPIVGRTSRISATAFTGRATPPPAEPDPLTTNLINKNSLQLAVVSSQIQGMTAQINSLAGSLQVIASSLATSQSLERQKEQQEQILESRLAQQKLREGKESVIEKKIQAATIRPAERLAQTAQFTLNRLGGFFTTLLGGWLLTRGVKTIKALSEGNTEELNNIKNNVLKNLALIAGVYVVGKFGLGLLAANFLRIGTRLLIISAAGLFIDPVKQFLKFVVDAGKLVWSELLTLLKDPGKYIREKFSDPSTPPEQLPPTGGSPPPEFQGRGGPSMGEPPEPTETLMGGKLNQGEEIGKQTPDNVISSGEIYNNVVGSVNNKFLERQSETKESEETLDPQKEPEYGRATLTAEDVEVTGQVPMEGDRKDEVKPEQLEEGRKSLLEMGFTTSEIQSFVDTEKYISKFGTLPPDMFTPVKKDAKIAERVSQTVKEPEVTVLPIAAEEPAPSQPQEQPVVSGGIASVDFYPTSNPDNIYTLGAYSNYNVVPV